MKSLQLTSLLQEIIDGQPNPQDSIAVDVPLFIRLLEYAREDAKDDMDLHKVTERIIALSSQGKTLSMSDYNQIVASTSTEQK